MSAGNSEAEPTATADRPRLGVSACLLGREVRHDGGHKRSDFLVDALAPHVELVPVCPEVEVGLPVPRNTLQLVGTPERPRLIEGATGTDRTGEMERWSATRIAALAALPLDGYAFKKGSPSCGLERVPVHRPGAAAKGLGSGLFAAALRRALPALPLTEEHWLDDPALRECFLDQLFTHHRLRVGLAAGGPAALPALHAAHRLLYLAHSPPHQKQLARTAERAAADPRPELADLYLSQAMAALVQPTSPGKHVNVLQHMLGAARDSLSPAERDEIVGLIARFRDGAIGLAAPLDRLAAALDRAALDGPAVRLYAEPRPRSIADR
jgi:uncharacterized protein YbbK (DUF523 family)/uncharacterized protein YbgA (DUF1722 family)